MKSNQVGLYCGSSGTQGQGKSMQAALESLKWDVFQLSKRSWGLLQRVAADYTLLMLEEAEESAEWPLCTFPRVCPLASQK